MCSMFQAEDGIRAYKVTGVQTCALPISDDERLGENLLAGLQHHLDPCLGGLAVGLDEASPVRGGREGEEEGQERSEEHTSELQSPCNIVCRLVREKKNRMKLGGVRWCTT